MGFQAVPQEVRAMVILCVTNCPPSLRGDLSRWINEINTGVYIGKLSGRVRDELWERVCGNIKNGQATMIYSAANVQGYEILVHNTRWFPKDFDGITLMCRPPQEAEDAPGEELKDGFSNAAKYARSKSQHKKAADSYVILDLETTGLDCDADRIIEIGALKIRDGELKAELQMFVDPERKIPSEIEQMTGISDAMIQGRCYTEKEAMEKLGVFIGKATVIGYNVKFDAGFIRCACERNQAENPVRNTKDVMAIARRKIEGIKNYKLGTVAEYFGLQSAEKHRALEDCRLVYGIYVKLNEL